jgi:transcriptional regulator with XRE-family HTH domain
VQLNIIYERAAASKMAGLEMVLGGQTPTACQGESLLACMVARYAHNMAESKVPNLKGMRNARQLTQGQLAAAVGVNTRTVLRWENGESEPGVSELSALAKFFSISVDQLVNDLLILAPTELAPTIKSLSDRDLDMWVAKSLGQRVRFVDVGLVYYEDGHGERPVPRYSTEWAQGGPLLEHNRIHLTPVAAGGMFDGAHLNRAGWLARCDDHAITAWGANALEAGMRAFVTVTLGRRPRPNE